MSPVWGGQSSLQMLQDTRAMSNRMGKCFQIYCSHFCQDGFLPPSPTRQSNQKANSHVCGIFIIIIFFLKPGSHQAPKANEVVLSKRTSPFLRGCESSSSWKKAQRQEFTVNSECSPEWQDCWESLIWSCAAFRAAGIANEGLAGSALLRRGGDPPGGLLLFRVLFLKGTGPLPHI